VLINNAGIFAPKPFVEYTPEDFQRIVSTNLAGFFYVSQAAARHMRQRRSQPISKQRLTRG
jgi:NAD(P)-dependent dehydrogenase (short-subunit alcohol dehydrogenase family)